MKILNLLSLALFVFFSSVSGEEHDPFPPFEELKPPVVMRQGAVVTVSPEGHFLVDNTPRYLEGVIYYEGTTTEVAIPTFGYPKALNWLYENTQDYRDLQRIGFDTAGAGAPNFWIDRYRPEKKYPRMDIDREKLMRFAASGLPLYLDYTCAPWSQGALRYEEGKLPSQAAFSVPGIGNNHWVPYNVTTPEGRRLWVEMWQYGARYFKELGLKPMTYELFNEPDYNDWSSHNRKLFVERMRKKYGGDIAVLNHAWNSRYTAFEELGSFERLAGQTALGVEYAKFMEEVFADICRDGVEAIREIDPRPEAGFCVQPLSGRSTNINWYLVNRHMNMICSGTGGGDIMDAHLLRAIADGKPIIDGETYMGKSRESFRDKILLQYARGFNASYIFKWSRRGSDPLWKKENGGKLLAELFPYMMLNPFSVPTEALLGLMDAKRELLAVGDLFAPRDRGIPRRVAVLYSNPTRRLARAAGHTSHALFDTYGEALEFSHIPIDALWEEQLGEGRQKRYDVLVAAGIDAVYPETADRLEQFVRDGGTLILGQEALQLNEYGFPRADNRFPGILPGKELSGERGKVIYEGTEADAAFYREAETDGYRTLAALRGRPLLLSRTLGKGEVYFLNARMPMENLGTLLRTILKRKDIEPVCSVTDASTGEALPRIEIVKAERDGLTGYILFNRGMAPILAKFIPPESVPFCDIGAGTLPERQEGALLLQLKPDHAVLLMGGEPALLEKRFGKMPRVTYEQTAREGAAWLADLKQTSAAKEKAFLVDPARIRTVDLRKYANRDFVDRVAGDGKGGWTDQGENSLHGVEWGVRDCNGVSFDFIRTDQNEERTCIVLGSKSSPELPLKVEGIRIDEKAERVFFLHATAWEGAGGQEAFRYIIRYADGRKIEIPVRQEIEIGDWYFPLRRLSSMRYEVGFLNSQKRGLFVWEWKNPHPAKTIASLDLVSADTKLTGILVAVTLEVPATGNGGVPFDPVRVSPWAGAAAEIARTHVELKLDDHSKDWCGALLTPAEPVAITPEGKNGQLIFEVNGGTDQWGRQTTGRQHIQVALNCKDKAGNQLKTLYITPPGLTIDADPGTWQPVSLPLAQLLPANTAWITAMSVQFKLLPTERCGVMLRNIRLVLEH